MSLVELTGFSGLRVDGLPEQHVALVKDNKGKILAKETITKFTPSQAYVTLQQVDSTVANKNISVVKEDELHLKLVTIEPEVANRRLMPIAQQFHSVPEARHPEVHLSDLLAVHALGRFNLELKKNVTIDSFDLFDTWRDDAGFIVTDRNIFELVTYNVAKFLPTLHPTTDATIAAYTAEDLDGVADFDNSVCGFSRDAFLELLAQKSQILVAKSGAIDGFIAGNGSKVHSLYAETLELAHALLKAYIEKNKLKEVTFFTRRGVFEATPVAKRQVHRRHTRAVPSSIKWTKVYALNMGVHIV